jgi:hypothetical protein
MTRHSGILLLPLCAALLVAPGLDAEIYRYVDENGAPHFTDSVHEIPPAYRDQVQDMEDQVATTDRFQAIEDFGRKGKRAQKRRARAEARAPAPSAPVESVSATEALEATDSAQGSGGWILALGAGVLIAGGLALRSYLRSRDWE